MSKVLVPLAQGFEEIEAMSIIDVLNRAQIEVVVAGLETLEVEGANTKLKVVANTLLDDVDVDSLDMIVLPGGLPGAEYLAKSEKVKSIVKALHVKNKKVAAICAAPWALKEAGVLDGVKHTNYPSFEKFTGVDGYIDNQDVVVDENVITSRGPATAMSFALEIVKILKGKEVYTQVKNGLLA
jgi:4-methyl-5(b-hydroxyethyl)-thiazole monophosphate biosynthesis